MPQTPAFRAAGTTSFTPNNVATPTTLTPGAPAGKAVGDLLILICMSRSNTATVATPTGWNIVTGFPKRSATTSGGSIYVFTRTADGTATDTPSPVWASLTTGTTGDSSSAVILCYTNTLTATLDGTIAVSDLSAQGTTSSITGLTTAGINSLVLAIAFKIVDSAAASTSTWTERVDAATTSGTGHEIEIADTTVAAAGASGASTVTWGTTTSSRVLGVAIGFTAAALATTDAATITSLTSISSVESAGFVDSDTPSTTTEPSSAEVYTPGGTTYTESSTITSTTTPSSVESAGFVDQATTPGITTPSTSDISAYIEVNTTTSITSLTTVEVFSGIDQLTTTSITTPSSTDVASFVDSGVIPGVSSLSTTDISQFSDLSTVITKSSVISSDIFASIDQFTISGTTSLTALEEHDIPDSSTILGTTYISTNDIAAFVDAFTLTGLTSLISVEGHEISDSGIISTITAPTTADIAIYVDGSTLSSITTPLSSEEHDIPDSSIIPGTTFITSSEGTSGGGTDSETASGVTSIDGTETGSYRDSATGQSFTSIVYSSITDSIDANTPNGVTSGTSTDVVAGTDSATPSSTTAISSQEQQAFIVIDSSVISGFSSVNYVDVIEHLDIGEVKSLTSITYEELITYVDASVVESSSSLLSQETLTHNYLDQSVITSITYISVVREGMFVIVDLIASTSLTRRWANPIYFRRWPERLTLVEGE